MTIGERIKNRRIELGLTQTELAERMGYTSRTSICTVEKDKEDLTTTRVKKFAEALETTPGYLMGWDETAKEISNTFLTIEKELKTDPKKTINNVIFNYNDKLIEMSEATLRAMKFYELYEKAEPNVKTAIDSLLRGNAPDSNSNP